jgi:hypothetical protein
MAFPLSGIFGNFQVVREECEGTTCGGWQVVDRRTNKLEVQFDPGFVSMAIRCAVVLDLGDQGLLTAEQVEQILNDLAAR